MKKEDIEKIAAMDFKQLKEDHNLCSILLEDILQKNQLAGQYEKINEGSQLVYSLEDRYIIKFFAKEDKEFYETEREFLSIIDGKLSIATPKIITAQYWSEYPYIIMEKIQGNLLKEVWQALEYQEKLELIRQLGETIQSLHAVPIEQFQRLPFKWEPFIKKQQKDFLTHHQNYQLDASWLNQLGPYLRSVPIDPLEKQYQVPLHTEIMLEHLFVQRKNGKLKLTGLIDFEPSMTGHREYDFCGVGLFITQGNSGLFKEFFKAYGLSSLEINDQLTRRIMTYLLYHRYCHLDWFRSVAEETKKMKKLEELEQFWFGV
ncbi:MAG: phosphotransferase [Spirochaetes bacterium]|nr:phosphotransferase [Spirochaetota bacterium]